VDDLWFRRFHDGPGSGPRLLCFPHAGGSAPFYFEFAKALSSHVEVLAMQYPARQDRRKEQHFGTIPELADQVVDVIGSVADRPFALFGHSMGGTVAFEVARRLEQGAGDPPVALFVSSRLPPSVNHDYQVYKRADNGLIEEIKLLSGTDSRLLLDDEILRMVLPTVRADYRAIETYRYEPGPLLAASLTALIGNADPRGTPSEMSEWAKYTTGSFDLHVFDGGHFYLNDCRADVERIVIERLCGP
jgi:surfactin synthase thioesterase subunit